MLNNIKLRENAELNAVVLKAKLHLLLQLQFLFWNIFSIAKEHMFCYDDLTKKEGEYRENNLSH